MPWTRTTQGSGTTRSKSTKSTRTYTARKNNGLGMSQASWRRMVINDALEEADELEAEFQARKRAREEEEAPTSASISAPKEKENAATIGSVLPPAKRQRVTRASKTAPVGTPYEGLAASSSATSSTATTSTRTTRSAAASATATATATSRNSSAIPPRYNATAPPRVNATTSASFARPTHSDMKAIPDALKPKIPVLFPEVFDPVLYAKFAAMYKAGTLPGYLPAGAAGVAADGRAPAPVAGATVSPGAATSTGPATSHPGPSA